MNDTEAIQKVRDIFQQGDGRYENPENAVLVSQFIENKAIKIEKKILTDIEVSEKESEGVRAPQQIYKVIGKRLLENLGYESIIFEVSIPGGRVDILAESKNKETIAVECCSCRIDKAIDFLKEGFVLWILSYGNGPIVKELPLYIVKKGENWDPYFREYENKMNRILKEVKSPFDCL